MRAPILLLAQSLLLLPLLPRGAWASSPQSFALGPPDDETPVVVKAGFFLKDINAVDEETQTFEFEGILTLQWKDPRQTFDAAELGVSERTYQGAFQFNEVFTGWWVQMVLANESRDYDRQGILLRIRPDGTLTYTEEVNGVAESPMRLSRFPFDRETFPLRFQVMGYDEAEVILEVDSTTTGHLRSDVSAVQWRFRDLRVSTQRDTHLFSDGGQKPVSTFVVEVDLARNPGFMLRVVVIPLALLVMLTWSVFWMDRESLGDRMDISFIGILTIVAYQIMISEHMPRIPYITLMAVFLYLSFAVLIASVVVNLVVGRLDRTGQKARGDRIDHHCRWIFPLVYVGLNVLAAALFFAVF